MAKQKGSFLSCDENTAFFYKICQNQPHHKKNKQRPEDIFNQNYGGEKYIFGVQASIKYHLSAVYLISNRKKKGLVKTTIIVRLDLHLQIQRHIITR